MLNFKKKYRRCFIQTKEKKENRTRLLVVFGEIQSVLLHKLITLFPLAVLILTTGFSDALVIIWRNYRRKEVNSSHVWITKCFSCFSRIMFTWHAPSQRSRMYSVMRRKTFFSWLSLCKPHLSLNSASLSEVSVWILGAPCVHNLSPRVCVFYVWPERLLFTLSNSGGWCRSCEFSQTTAQDSVEMKKINWSVCYVALVASYLEWKVLQANNARKRGTVDQLQTDIYQVNSG